MPLLHLWWMLYSDLETKSRRSLAVFAVVFFLAVIGLQMTLLARANSCTWDEADHTYSGYMQWKGHFDIPLAAA